MNFGPYPAIVKKVIDGDTVDLEIDLGFGIWATGFRARIYGINAPELRTDQGKRAKQYAQGLLPVGSKVTVLSKGWDKYGGRFDAVLTLPSGQDFSQAMLLADFAVPFP